MHDDAEVADDYAEVADDNANTQIVTGQRSRVHSTASLTLEIFGDTRTTNTRHR